MGTAALDNAATGCSCHAGTEAMTAGTNKAAWLKSTFLFHRLTSLPEQALSQFLSSDGATKAQPTLNSGVLSTVFT